MATAAGLAGTRRIGRVPQPLPRCDLRGGEPAPLTAGLGLGLPLTSLSERVATIDSRSYPGNPGPPTASTPAPTGPEVPMD